MSRRRRKIRAKTKLVAGVPAWMARGNMSKVSQREADDFKVSRMGTFGAASKVRRIDPITGLILETASSAEVQANDILRADKSQRRSKSRKPRKRANLPVKNTPENREAFYRSWEWRTLRMEVLKEQGRQCACCGATPEDAGANGRRVRVQVDHIRPLSKFWNMRLSKANLQVLCEECNQGKGAWDETDWRRETILHDEPLSPIEQQLGERLRVIDGGCAA